jgi:putative addiction module killer protein
MLKGIVLKLNKTKTYLDWYTALRDREARNRIDVRILRLTIGNPGRSRNLGGEVSELKIDYGPG